MAIIAIDKTLDVITKYNSLITESLDTESVYIRTKETLIEFFNSGSFTGQEKARIIAEVLSNLNSSLVNASITTALEWAKAEKTFEFEKEELGYKVDVIDQQAEVEAAKVKQLMADVMATTATSMRQNGAATINPSTGFTTGLANDGKVWKEMVLMEQELLNKKAEEDVLQSKLKESQAAVYKIVADTAANFGSGTYTISDTGVTSAGFDSPNSLAYFQKQIAAQQAKGYAYNAWANAVNASSTAVSMLLSTESSSSTIQDAAGTLSGYLVSGVEKLITKAVLPS